MNMGRVMVTGAGGFLGRHLCRKLEAAGYEVKRYCHADLDITDRSAVAGAVSLCRPDIVVNCAAISSTGYAKEHPEESLAVNVEAPVNLALACRECGAELFVMSSDQVYGGCRVEGPLKEDLPLEPNNVYGQHKLLMEGRVLEILPSAKALRLTWMCQPLDAEHPHQDYVSNMLAAKAEGRQMKASALEHRGITDVRTVCEGIIGSFGLLPGGVYNFGSGNLNDSYTTMIHLAEVAGYPVEDVTRDVSWGRNLAMDCSRLEAFGIIFPSTEESVGKALAASHHLSER